MKASAARRLRCPILLATAMIALILSACRPATVVTATVDLLSYLPLSPAGGDVLIPSVQPLRIYLLPGFQVDDATAGPDPDMRRGSLVEYSSLESIESARPTARVDIVLGVSNNGPTHDIPASSILVVAASEDAANIYEEGVPIEEAEFPALGAGQSTDYTVSAEVDSDHPAYPLILSGSFRIGVLFQADANPSGPVPAGFLVKALTCEVSLVPFGLLPGGISW